MLILIRKGSSRLVAIKTHSIMKTFIIRNILDGNVIDTFISNDNLVVSDEMKKMLDKEGYYITYHGCDLVVNSNQLMTKILSACRFELMDEDDFLADEEVEITVE
jgi:hypothetical protein